MLSQKVVDARADAEGDISNAHTVCRRSAKPHLRTNADGKQSSNLDDMAGDT